MADIVIETDAVDRGDREAFWHSVLGDTFAPVHVESWTAASDPTASLRSTTRGRLMFVELDATPHVHRRTQRLIRRSDSTFFQLAVVTKGFGTLQQEDRLAELGTGDLVIYENSRPFTWTFTEQWAAAAVCIPSDAVRLTESERREMSARALSGRVGLSGVVSRFVRDISEHAADIPEAQSERILAQATDLAVSLLGTPDTEQYRDARYRTVRERIKGYIDSNLHDPALGPAQIASAMNISTRYLHKLFEDEHETVALYVRGIRLQRARDRLLDPRFAGHSIAGIAHHCGFGDVRGFTRTFRAAYGVNPGELRRGGVRQVLHPQLAPREQA